MTKTKVETVRALASGTDYGKGMQSLLDAMKQIAMSDFSVLIVGELGTGKEWAARRIHEMSYRSKGPFVYIDCIAMDTSTVDRERFAYAPGASPSGEHLQSPLERAKGGTMFFDEISNLPPAARGTVAKLFNSQSILHSTSETPVPLDVRFIASLSRRPEVVSEENTLRTGMYHRISPIIVNIPPLREHREDIPHLIEDFLNQSNLRHGTTATGISAEALRLCLMYDWPGNVRQLRNAIEYAAVMCSDDLVQPGHLPIDIQGNHQHLRRKIVLQENISIPVVEKLLIEHALSESRTKKQAAAVLGISLKTLYNKLYRYNLYDRFITEARNGNSSSAKHTRGEAGVHPSPSDVLSHTAEGPSERLSTEKNEKGEAKI